MGQSAAIQFMETKSFADFWPHYVRGHLRPRTRLLHAIGTALAVALFGLALAVNLWILAAVPLAAYGFAWYAHRFVEHNRPATFEHPFYAVAAEFRMLFLMMAGRMDDEVAKASGAAKNEADKLRDSVGESAHFNSIARP